MQYLHQFIVLELTIVLEVVLTGQVVLEVEEDSLPVAASAEVAVAVSAVEDNKGGSPSITI